MEWFALLLYDKLDNFPSVSRWQMNGRGIFSSACFISQSFPIGEGCARAASTMQSCVHVHVLCPMTCSVSDHKLCVWLNVSCIITLLCLIFRACKQRFYHGPGKYSSSWWWASGTMDKAVVFSSPSCYCIPSKLEVKFWVNERFRIPFFLWNDFWKFFCGLFFTVGVTSFNGFGVNFDKLFDEILAGF